MARSPRRPTSEELFLWRRATRDVQVIDPSEIASDEDLTESAAPRVNSERAVPLTPRMPTRSPRAAPDPLPTPKTRRGHVAGLDRTISDRLKRGEVDIDARLDLHGMRQHQAHQRLTAFIRLAHAMDHRTVLVITGKGQDKTGSDQGYDPYDRPGVLRKMLPHWLEEAGLRPLIAAVVPAHRRHGGVGAVYIYLRRRRDR